MKKLSVITFILFINILYCQSNVGLIIGEGVRVRKNNNAKSNEVSKVHGIRKVTIIEESSEWDDLGEEGQCGKHKWIKVKWGGDSTGWVYGKYCFQRVPHALIDLKATIELNSTKYEVITFQNFAYPFVDDDGYTGCSETDQIILYEVDATNYFQISDISNKTLDSFILLYSNESQGEYINNIKVKDGQIVISVTSASTSMDWQYDLEYSIEIKKGQFIISDFKKTQVKN